MEEMSLEQGLEEIGHKILVLTRNELYMKMRFMWRFRRFIMYRIFR